MSSMEQSLAVAIKTAAQLLEVSPSTIRRAIKSGHLKTVRIGRSVRILRGDLHDWVRSRYKSSQS